VIAGFQIHLRLLLDAIIHDDIEPVAFADRRHRAGGTVPKQTTELPFIGEIDVFAELPPEVRQAEMMRRGQNREHVPAVATQHDAFGEPVA